jgi:hypothetical protein
MSESLYAILPAIAAAGFVGGGVLVASRSPTPSDRAWLAPAAGCLAFALWTGWAVVAGGPVGFWREHTGGPWANQIWFDLLLAALIGFGLLAPRARAAGMSPLSWFALVVCTGSIGLLAMTARCLFLEAQPRNASER